MKRQSVKDTSDCTVQRIGERVPRLLFINDEKGARYFKEDIILPEEIPPREALDDPDNDSYYLDKIVYCARSSAGISPGRNLGDRAIATSLLAKKLKIDDFIIPVKRADFSLDDETLYGSEMPAVGGVSYINIMIFPPLKGYRLSYTPEAVRQLTILVLFDFICGQVDRHSGNIRLVTDIDYDNIGPPAEGSETFPVKSINVIDHDLCFGEYGYDYFRKKVNAGHCICPELLGEMQYTAVDAAFLKEVLSIDREDFFRDFSDLLTKPEMDAFFDRLSGFYRIYTKEKNREDERRASGEHFFSRFLDSYGMYEEYLGIMEEYASKKTDINDLRFSYLPTYLKKRILLHEPLRGELDDEMKCIIG